MRFLVTLALVVVASPVFAYVDLATTLSRIVAEGQSVTVVEVERFSREKGAVVLKKVRDLKGKTPDGPVRQVVARTSTTQPAGALPIVPRVILEWAEPGRRAIVFSNNSLALVCVGQGWYQLQSSADGWWRLGPDRPDLPLAYYGSLSRLESAVEQMLAGKSAVITTLPHGSGNEGASFDLALNRTALPGLMRVQRIRADLRMPGVVMAVANNPAYYVGQGVAGGEELPGIIKRLDSPEVAVRAEAADDLRAVATQWASRTDVGPLLRPSLSSLTRLLKDPSPVVRGAAEAAVLRLARVNSSMEPVRPATAKGCTFVTAEALYEAAEALRADLASADTVTRRHAVRAAGLGGDADPKVIGRLAELLGDSDEITRALALEAIATLGPDAAGAMGPVAKLLDNPATVIDAADALGRMGAAAATANPKLAKLLQSDLPTVRWAGARAMAQIGSPSAAPAVDFLIRVLKNNPSEVDGYNTMIYLGLLGPVAKPAIPTIEQTRIKNPVLGQYAIWAIEPETRFPWLGGGGGGRFGFGGRGGGGPGGMAGGDGPEFAKWIGESFLIETGERFKPAAKILAAKALEGGDLPWMASRVMSRFPDAAVEPLTAALASPQLQTRERATVAIGNMGPGAGGAREGLEKALKATTNGREQRLIQWALRQTAGE